MRDYLKFFNRAEFLSTEATQEMQRNFSLGLRNITDHSATLVRPHLHDIVHGLILANALVRNFNRPTSSSNSQANKLYIPNVSGILVQSQFS